MNDSLFVIFGLFGWLLSLLLTAVVLPFVAALQLLLVPIAFAGFLALAYSATLGFDAVKTKTQKLE